MVQNKSLTEKLTFRHLSVDDIDDIITIDNHIVRRKRSKLFRGKLHEQLATHGDESLGAVTPEGKLIGYILAETIVYIYGSDDLSAWIVLLGVDPSYQDKGIGTALVTKMFTHFSKKGVKVIRTICQWDWGDLVEFFSSVGFKPSEYLTLERETSHNP
ncbi:MAG: GNAT family N-acetyltransferase [Candidatus Hermodarchaeota archaeon]